MTSQTPKKLFGDRFIKVSFIALAMTAGLAPLPVAAEDNVRYKVEKRPVEALWSSEAIIEADRLSTISAQVSGTVLEILYRPGDTVPAGAVILRIDPAIAEQEVIGMDARINEARVNLDNARRQYQRARSLLSQEYISQADYDRIEAAFKSAQAQLNTLLAGRGQAKTTADYATVTAPYGGVMAELHVEVGEMAVPGKPLATGFDPDALRATARVPQAVIGKVRESLKAYIQINDHGEWLAAQKVQVLPVADPLTHDTEVRVFLPAGMKDTTPGQFARVHFVVGNERRLTVPRSAIVQRAELTAVYVEKSGGKPALRQVRLGKALADGQIEVLSGLLPGEQVSLTPVATTRQAE